MLYRNFGKTGWQVGTVGLDFRGALRQRRQGSSINFPCAYIVTAFVQRDGKRPGAAKKFHNIVGIGRDGFKHQVD